MLNLRSLGSFLVLTVFSVSPIWAHEGPGGTGGGDPRVIDIVKMALQLCNSPLANVDTERFKSCKDKVHELEIATSNGTGGIGFVNKTLYDSNGFEKPAIYNTRGPKVTIDERKWKSFNRKKRIETIAIELGGLLGVDSRYDFGGLTSFVVNENDEIVTARPWPRNEGSAHRLADADEDIRKSLALLKNNPNCSGETDVQEKAKRLSLALKYNAGGDEGFEVHLAYKFALEDTPYYDYEGGISNYDKISTAYHFTEPDVDTLYKRVVVEDGNTNLPQIAHYELDALSKFLWQNNRDWGGTYEYDPSYQGHNGHMEIGFKQNWFSHSSLRMDATQEYFASKWHEYCQTRKISENCSEEGRKFADANRSSFIEYRKLLLRLSAKLDYCVQQ